MSLPSLALPSGDHPLFDAPQVDDPRPELVGLLGMHIFEEGDDSPDVLRSVGITILPREDPVATPPPPPIEASFASAGQDVIAPIPQRLSRPRRDDLEEVDITSNRGSSATIERSIAVGSGPGVEFGHNLGSDDESLGRAPGSPPDSGFERLQSRLANLQADATAALHVPQGDDGGPGSPSGRASPRAGPEVQARIWDQQGPTSQVITLGERSSSSVRIAGRVVRAEQGPPPAYVPRVAALPPGPRPLLMANRLANRDRTATRGLDELLVDLGAGSVEDRLTALESAIRATNDRVTAIDTHLAATIDSFNRSTTTLQNHITQSIHDSEDRILRSLRQASGVQASGLTVAPRPAAPPARVRLASGRAARGSRARRPTAASLKPED